MLNPSAMAFQTTVYAGFWAYVIVSTLHDVEREEHERRRRERRARFERRAIERERERNNRR